MAGREGGVNRGSVEDRCADTGVLRADPLREPTKVERGVLDDRPLAMPGLLRQRRPHHKHGGGITGALCGRGMGGGQGEGEGRGYSASCGVEVSRSSRGVG